MMSHKSCRGAVIGTLLAFLANCVHARQPPQPGSPAAAPPAIAPNFARLDQTLGGLDGPGFALAYDESSGTLAAACEGRSIHYWDKAVTQGVRGGSAPPNVLKEHAGPV